MKPRQSGTASLLCPPDNLCGHQFSGELRDGLRSVLSDVSIERGLPLADRTRAAREVYLDILDADEPQDEPDVRREEIRLLHVPAGLIATAACHYDPRL